MRKEQDDRYTQALAALQRTFSDESKDRIAQLIAVVQRECDSCERYLREFPDKVDDTERWRREQTAGQREAKKQRIAVARLAQFARNHAFQAETALAFALREGGFNWSREEANASLADSFAQTLIAYEQNLSTMQWNPEMFIQSTQYFNLLMPHRAKRRSPTLKPSTGLMLKLVAVFRKFSSGDQSFGRFQWGEQVPTVGTPHYELAADFASAATGDEIALPKDRLEQFLSGNPGIGLAKWPTLQPRNA